MAEEFQGGVCGGNWWSSSRNLFGSSLCSLASNDVGWLNNHDLIMDMKTPNWSSDDSTGSASDDVQKLHQTNTNGSMSMDSTVQMMGNWNQNLLHDSGSFLQEGAELNMDSNMNYQHQNKLDSFHQSINSFKQVNQSSPQLSNSISSSVSNCNSDSYSHVSSLLQTLFDTDSESEQYLLHNQAMNYSSEPNYPINSNGFLQDSPMLQQPTNSTFPITNNTPLSNPSTFIPSTHYQFQSSLNNKRPNPSKFGAKNFQHQNEESKELASATKKANSEPSFKRPRIETPSPLPTFKVRKEKLGDRITALQQLVSPFGKTDTASVLQEAIEYIKFLHHQVNEFSTPYLKYGSPPLQRQQVVNKPKNQEGLRQDLKSRGLCLVPISSTFPVAAETTTNFWTPTFGGNLK